VLRSLIPVAAWRLSAQSQVNKEREIGLLLQGKFMQAI